MLILFQGDSVTQEDRNIGAPNDLGTGYVGMINDMIAAKYPGRDIKLLNRGISGHKVADLAERWDRDCVVLKPDMVTVLIGINDTWHRFSGSGGHVTTDAFYAVYKEILDKTRKVTERIILMEPFLLPVRDEMHRWREDLDGKIHAVRRLAVEYKTLYVPLDGLFAAAYARDGMAKYAPDGVHPSSEGCRLIAEAWVDAAFGA
jgi:lysophospholipase L1-like esterase